MKRPMITLSLLVPLAALVSCNRMSDEPRSTGRVPSEEATPATTSPTSSRATASRRDAAPVPHGLRHDQLSALMKLMAARTQQDWPEEVPGPLDDQRTGETARVIESARKMSASLAPAAERIPMSVAHVPMSDADRAGFNAEADTLRDQALKLGNAARAKDTEQIRKLLNGISSTCISCHSRYRDFAGQLDLQLALGGR